VTKAHGNLRAFEIKILSEVSMKRLAVVGSICASFLVGGAMTAFAQDEHREEKQDEHARQEEHHEERRRIADEHYRAKFGHDHHFAIRHVTVVEGRPHFAYGGYNFEIAQAWPGGWSYNDDVYIEDVDGGYYLFNLRHPGVRVAVGVIP
jgi:Ni/Co efflux regulator RcnB